MQAGQRGGLCVKERFQCVPSVGREPPSPVEVSPKAAGVPPEVSGDLGETCAQAPLFGFHALGEGPGLRCGVVAEEGHDGSELGRHGLGFVFLPIQPPYRWRRPSARPLPAAGGRVPGAAS